MHVSYKSESHFNFLASIYYYYFTMQTQTQTHTQQQQKSKNKNEFNSFIPIPIEKHMFPLFHIWILFLKH